MQNYFAILHFTILQFNDLPYLHHLIIHHLHNINPSRHVAYIKLSFGFRDSLIQDYPAGEVQDSDVRF